MDEGLTRRRRVALITAVVASLAAAFALVEANAAQARHCVAGAAGAGDPYFPMAGNGGYNARHYDLDLSYDPVTGALDGHATIEARAERRLCSFNPTWRDSRSRASRSTAGGRRPRGGVTS